LQKIAKISIENFKSIKKAGFELSEFTPLVGYNNAGKTNILQAIIWSIKKSSLGVSSIVKRNTEGG
jgi:predicted ATP-dependent endonuclease of OLD family